MRVRVGVRVSEIDRAEPEGARARDGGGGLLVARAGLEARRSRANLVRVRVRVKVSVRVRVG